jgi:hypothetical protein
LKLSGQWAWKLMMTMSHIQKTYLFQAKHFIIFSDTWGHGGADLEE